MTMMLAMLSVGAAALPSCGDRQQPADAAEGWRTDMAWIRDSLPLLHYDLFMYQPRESLLVRLERLEARIDSIGDMEAALGLTGVLASMECSHTGIAFWDQCEIRAFPLSVIWLEEGIFVTAADTSFAELIGSRLTGYDGRQAEEAAAAMAGLFSSTNETATRTSAERFMMLSTCMSALGYGNPEGTTDFVFIRDSGDTTKLSLAPMDFTYSNMLYFNTAPGVELPIWLSSDDCYWFRYLPDRRMLYCAYNSCGLMQGYPMERFVEQLDSTLRVNRVADLVVDLRRNGGGNSLVATPLIQWLRGLPVSGGPRTSLIVGRWTYSSGILNAQEIAAIPGVTVYGERTGGSPNHLGEVRTAVLPYSGLTVSYPTKYFETVDSPGRTMTPDFEVPLTPDMLFHGSNRILDLIGSHTRSGVTDPENE
ncbi:MAG: hypothetical protein AVO35_04780 [Candidatus Aegiribacteria sp. MLS_C]|nr:MAG: hypothetical protein AVO35_04780 [Candidatus Aegiribacteria sp. MLS_C]